ncbi:MAG: pentapeptide repeat-containing protein [Candidatus Omnitrophica bacterium]|nr:pentapeptide repeat-containing protein [Candidatus Omnitrophota bacterium]MCM8790260.1 pentapeptide repeat-containing protein [Candidatus Omnitrophota bacterium]
MNIERCVFKGCEEHAVALSQFCWDHMPQKDSYATSLTNAASSGQDLSDCNLRKAVLKGARFERASFRKANFAQADLSSSHFFDCNLEGADFVGANISGCDMAHCNLRGSDLTKACLTGARFWNSDLSGANLTEADLSGSDLWNARLFNVKLWHTILAGAKSITKMSFSSGARFFDNPRINESGAPAAEESYRDLKQYFITCGMYNDASWASFKEKSMERIILKKKGDWIYIPSLVMNILCGYGEKPYRIVTSAITAITLYAILYHSFNSIERTSNPSYILRWYDYLYYSTITFTTVGYGDFVPRQAGFFKMLSATEAFCGVFLTGLFIFTLARKYSAR